MMMPRRACACLGPFLLALAGCAASPPPLRKPEVHALVESWVRSWNDYDLRAVDELFLTDERLTYFSSEKPGLIAGIDAVREHHRSFGFTEGGATKDATLWLEELEIRIHDRTAVVSAEWCFRGGPEGSRPVQKGPVTLVAVSTEAGARIAHAHFANDPVRKE